MIKGITHVTLRRSLWRSIATQAAGFTREAGGLLIGRRTQMNTFIIEHDVALAHKYSKKNQVAYDHDEVDRSKAAAYAMYGPELEPIGGWHNHPWPRMTMESLLPQISDYDVEEMIVGDIELIVTTFPYVVREAFPSEFCLERKIGEIQCRAEAYIKINEKEAKPCTISVR